jgi:putative ABC transport system permease protein
MRVLRGLGLSTRALFAHKVRTTLALASVAVGVAAVVVTGAIGTGAEKEVLRRTESMGTNLLVVRPAQIKTSAARKQIRGVVTNLKLEDYEAIRELAPVEEAVPGAESRLTVKAGSEAMPAMVMGTTSPYIDVCRFHLQRGRFLDDDDNFNARRVAVLGARVNDTLFDGQDAIGHDIRIRGVPFEIIGVLAAKGVLADGSDEDNEVLIPIRTALRRVFNSTWLNPVFVSVRNPGEMSETENAIAKLLRDRHRLDSTGEPDDFSIQNKTRALAAQKQLAESLNLLATSLAAISLFVGGAGILALMLMSVKERTGEIGLRIAVGARPRDILVQFLMEATFLAVGGWAVGITLGTLVAAVVAFATRWKLAMSPEQVLATLGMVLTIALGFGAYPARKASLVPPIEALQVE